jgi:hypothetical protein
MISQEEERTVAKGEEEEADDHKESCGKSGKGRKGRALPKVDSNCEEDDDDKSEKLYTTPSKGGGGVDNPDDDGPSNDVKDRE